MKLFRRVILISVAAIVSYFIYYAWVSLPVATSYAAKVVCSAVFISERNEKSVINDDLDFFPVSFSHVDVDRENKVVSTSVFGLAKRKAIYRDGLGATLVNDVSLDALRAQQMILPPPPPINADSLAWPNGNKIQHAFPVNVDSARVMRAVDRVFEQDNSKFKNETRALIVLYDGQIIAERYANGFNQDMPLPGWSMTKSITGAMVGLLVKQGKLRVDDPAPVAAWQNDKRKNITIRHLLQQTSGLRFDEVYSKNSHATRMLFLKGDASAYAASLPLENEPGTQFSYSSGNSNILSRIIREAVGDGAYYRFPYGQLFYKLGMFHTILEPDAGGTFVGSSYCYATARDWARFALLYYNDGIVNGERILPEGWVKESVQPSIAAKRGEYGYQWWLNAGRGHDRFTRMYQSLPTDMYYADGYEGQNIFIIPSKKLIVVRLGITRNKTWAEENLISELIGATK